MLGAATSSDRSQVINAYRRALELSGEPERGSGVFKKACATCHKAENVGVDVGPNLATITGRSPEDLLIHILDPNREVAPPYFNYNAALADGSVLSGLIADESANSVTLKRAEGATDVVPRGRIEAISSTGLSLMPEGLEKGLEPQDFADLIAYLKSIQASGPAPVQHGRGGVPRERTTRGPRRASRAASRSPASFARCSANADGSQRFCAARTGDAATTFEPMER